MAAAMGVRPSTTTRRAAIWALVALGLVSCAGRRRGSGGGSGRRVGLRSASRPASGRPAGCPEDAVDPFGDDRPGPMDLRCSYADAPGGRAVRLEGGVHLSPAPGATLGDALGDVMVRVHQARPDGSLGPVVAEATTDAQGGFSIAALLPAGEYVLVLPAVVPGPPQATRRFAVGEGDREIGDLDLLVVPPGDAP